MRGVLMVALALVLAGCEGQDAAGDDNNASEEVGTPVAAVELTRRDLSRQLSTSATVQPRVQVRLASRGAGTVQAVYAEEGDAVEAGQLLVQLDVAEAQAEVAQAQAEHAQASQEYGRAAELRSRGHMSESEYERLRTALRVAESRERLWQTRVEYGQVRAPRDAVVTARHVEPGEAVEAHETVLELAALDELVIQMGVSELDVVHLERGQRVPIELDAMPGLVMEGSIRRIFPQAETSSRLVTVEAALPEGTAEQGVRPGYLARVRMPIDERANVVAVPSSAIGEDGDEHYVYVIEDGRLHRRVIERGVSRGQWTQANEGLEAGEIILATNPIDMSEGDAVRIVGWRG